MIIIKKKLHLSKINSSINNYLENEKVIICSACCTYVA